MKISTLTLIATLIAPVSTHLYAQSQTGSSTPGTTPTGVLPPIESASGTQIQTSPGAQLNSGTGTLNQPATGGGGVFGPSAGPGIFGPTGQVTTDIYGNQQATPGTSVQGTAPSLVPQGAAGTNLNRRRGVPGQAGTQPTTDAQGNSLPLNNQGQQAPLPRDINPLPNQAPAGTMTGR